MLASAAAPWYHIKVASHVDILYIYTSLEIPRSLETELLCRGNMDLVVSLSPNVALQSYARKDKRTYEDI